MGILGSEERCERVLCVLVQELCLNGIEEIVAKVGAGVEYLYADDLVSFVELCGYVGRYFHTARLAAFFDANVDDVVLFEVVHVTHI